ncbi:hypothetical protein DEU56DRAFT_963130 [Suillus clintonianus]|uniref:uncharacterized protein n=1 Tax=Suillus clintonianus TaxID=1904413 RepID=UPI001B8602BF|nr:uncharacterized protein DEU56DRAFT_963130 [Suillus clintonianus]KAG2124860.1 hypothetical protein DEU56DRAFT_963130 [Suillus clintonianus]
MQTCPACGRDGLTFTGLSQHLAKSRDPRCQALYRSRQPVNSTSAEDHHMEDEDEPVEPPVFEGDDFEGENYGEVDYEMEWRDDVSESEYADSDSDDGGISMEPEWEPPVPDLVGEQPQVQEDEVAEEDPGRDDRLRVQERAQGQHGFIAVPYPDSRAGQEIRHHADDDAANARYGAQFDDGNNPYFPFCSQIDWEIARWSKLRGPTSTAFTDLLAINGVRESLGLSFKNAKELNAIIDNELPTGRPKFKCEQIVVAGEAFDVYHRDVIECIEALYGDPDFADYLAFTPERHYADEDQTTRLFHDMYTGKWWWDTQKKLDQHCPGGTIIPIIISSDKTQVTMFRNKAAYPVYLTIGNIPKEIRRKPSRSAHILLGYLPTTRLEHIPNKASRRRTISNLYHACMSRILGPLERAGLDGVKMRSGDGALRRCHPLFASFVGDYPEQLLATGVKFMECPKCDIDADDTGSNTAAFHLRNLGSVLDALAALDQGSLAFVRACATVGIKPIVHPFWEDLPFANIFRAITPDVLHQLYQGLVKHLVQWLSEACGAVEIDARCRRLPPNHNIRLFTKGITTLSRLSGKEHAQIRQFLLGIIIDIRLPNNLNAGRLLRAVRGLLDFLYLAQYPCHSSETLELLHAALDTFHDNKGIFVDLGIRNNFNLPKLHAARHYPLMIMLFGTTDNYNTEYTERLHIDIAKDAYRATNHKDEFIQMTIWLERKEKIFRHDKYIHWRISGGRESVPHHPRPPDMSFRREQVMTKHPSAKAVSLQKLVNDYGATYFREALARYIARLNCSPHHVPRGQELDDLAIDIHFPFRTLPVFHKIKWLSLDTRGHGDASVTLDSIHAKPQHHSGSRLVARRSDTALVDRMTGAPGLKDFRVGQVRAIFALPPTSIPMLFSPTVQVPSHLAYIEWFTPFPPAPDRNHGFYKLSRALARGGERLASIVPVANILCSTHLVPRFGAVAPREWTSGTVLDDCESFWLNLYLDRHTFAKFK